MDIILNLISSGAIAFGVSTAIVLISRTWLSERIKNSIKHEYDEKLETHKAKLKSTSDVEIERLRAQLNITAAEQQVRFTRLHDTRADTISEAYSTLKTLLFHLGEYVKAVEFSGEPTRQERFENLVKAHKAFFDAYSLKLIFFPEAVAKKLDDINADCVRAGNSFRYFVDIGEHPDKHKKWIEISDTVETKIKDALHDLEVEFRHLLGDA